MAICPSGHESASDDFCDVCGLSIGAPPLSSADAGGGLIAPPAGTQEACPRCGAARAGQFCEDCGYNFADGGARAASPLTPSPSAACAAASVPAEYQSAPSAAPGRPAGQGQAPGTVRESVTALLAGNWSAVVTADRDYFDNVRAASGPDTAGIGFPAYCPQRRFRLSGGEVRIGRRSASRGIEPEIDLTGPPSDPGISRLHAVLIAAPDGSWSVLDPGSANGTLVNGTEIGQDQPVPLRDGDRINLGAWTLVTISRG